MSQSKETGSGDAGQGTAESGDPAAALEAEVDHAIAQCDGDMRATIRALLVLVRHLETELLRLRGAVSRGYVRGDLYGRLAHADRLADGHPGQR